LNCAPEDQSKTALWLEAPTQLPDRTDLTMHVSLRDANGAAVPGAWRMQVTRKLEFSPLFLR
jgi:hypothetical protein